MEWLDSLKDAGGGVIVAAAFGFFAWKAWDKHHTAVVVPREVARTNNETAESAARATATLRSAEALEKAAEGIGSLKVGHDSLRNGQRELLDGQKEIHDAVRQPPRPHRPDPGPA